MRRILLLLPIFFITQTLFAQSFEFFKEEIVFEINPVFFIVNGDYYFRNTTSRAISPTISYPVRRADPGKPFDTIMVYDQADLANPLKLKIVDTVAIFTVHLPPNAEKMIKVTYRQRHNGTDARYILLTTRFWNKALEDVRYSVVVMKNITIKHFSIAPDKSIDFGDTTIYYWKRKNFMPEKDFEVQFKVTGK
jgi:hypothetical protein